MKKLVLVSLCAALLMLSACSWSNESYYADHPMTADELVAKWGQPSKVVKMEDGSEKWVIDAHCNGISNMYYIVKDGKVVKSGVL